MYMKFTYPRSEPQKRLIEILPKNSGRGKTGQVTVRHQGGRHKRYYRLIDWKRDKREIPAQVIAVEYDPNRSAHIVLLHYQDGEKRYILAPQELKVGSVVTAGKNADITVGNALPLSNIPIGLPIHNIELHPGRGGQAIRSAGSSATIIAKDTNYAQIKFPSGEIHRISLEGYATIGQVSNEGWKEMIIGKAGRSRRMGIRPTVRGVAMNPHAHPHGGGEGRSGEGMAPKTPWGKPARGKKTRKKIKWSNKYIVQRRK